MTTLQAFLHDVGGYIKERAQQAVQVRDCEEVGSLNRQYQNGRVMGFNEAISILQQTAKGFDIPLSALSLEDIEPDRDLV